MASNTRRMSGMAQHPNGQLQQPTWAADAIDAIRRKHVSQNKEVIHRNSDLMRANTDLSEKLRKAQADVIALRNDNATLLAANAHLEQKNASLREQLKEAHSELRRRPQGVSMDEEHFQALRITVDKVVAQLQGAQAICLLTTNANQQSRRVYTPASPPESPPFAQGLTASQQQLASALTSHSASSSAGSSTSKADRRASTAAVVSAQPDLSFISEGSQEPSISSSQRDYKPYSSDEEEDGQEDSEETARLPSVGAHYEDQRLQVPFLDDRQQDYLAASYASSVEPDHVGRDIEASLLSTSPKRPPPMHPFSLSSSPLGESELATSTSTSASPTPTPTLASFSTMPDSFFPNTASLELTQETTIPPSASSSAPTTRKRHPRPSLLEQMGVSPGHLDISFGQGHASKSSSAAATDGGRRTSRMREVSPTPVLTEQVPAEGEESESEHEKDDDEYCPRVTSSRDTLKTATRTDPNGLKLSRTVRHSNSATTLRESAKAAAAAAAASVHAEVLAPSPGQQRIVTRRRSNPTLSSSAELAASANAPANRLSGVTLDRKRLSSSSVDAGRGKATTKLVSSMQSRPSGQLLSLDGKTAALATMPKGVFVKPPTAKLSIARPSSAVHRRLPSTSPTNTKNAQSIEAEMSSPVTSAIVSQYSDSPAPSAVAPGRTRPFARAVTRSRSSSPEVEVSSSRATAAPVLSDLTSQSLPQKGRRKSSPKKEKGKLKSTAEEQPPLPTKRQSVDARERELSPEIGSLESNNASMQDLSTTSVPGLREGRRSRGTVVSYQEPSLNKKMRQPAGYVASIKTVSAKHGVHNLGVRRKSSLSLGAQPGSGRISVSPGPSGEVDEAGDETRQQQHEELECSDVELQSGGETSE